MSRKFGGLLALLVALASSSLSAQPNKPAAGGAALKSQAAAAAAAATAGPDTRLLETTTFDGWTVACRGWKSAGAPTECSATFSVSDQKSGAVLASWLLSTRDGKITSEVVTITGIQVDKGVELIVGAQGKPKKFAYVWCESNQCSAQGVLEDAVVKELLANAQSDATLTSILKDGRALNFKLPLAGIDRAIARLKN